MPTVKIKIFQKCRMFRCFSTYGQNCSYYVTDNEIIFNNMPIKIILIHNDVKSVHAQGIVCCGTSSGWGGRASGLNPLREGGNV